MALTLSNSSTQYWQRPMGFSLDAYAGQTTSGQPGMSFCAWVRVRSALTTVLAGDYCSLVGAGSTSTQSIVGLLTDEFSGIYSHSFDDVSLSPNYTQNGNYVLGAWTPVLGVLPSNGDQKFYSLNSNGTSGNLNTNTTTLSFLCVGFQQSVASTQGPWVSTNLIDVAEFAMWRSTLTQTEATRFFGGANPLTLSRKSLYAYYPLRNSLADYGPQGLGLIPMGGAQTVWTDHPPVNLIPRQRLFSTGVVPLSASNNVFMTSPWT